MSTKLRGGRFGEGEGERVRAVWSSWKFCVYMLLGGAVVCGAAVAILWACHPVPNRMDQMLEEVSSLGVDERLTAEDLRVLLRERGFFWERDRHQYAAIRCHAITRAWSAGVTEVAPDVISLLETDENDAVRMHAAIYLLHMAIDGTSPALRKALKNDPSASVRVEAAFGVGHLREPGCVEALVAASRDPDVYVRDAVAHGLGSVGTPKAISALKSILGNDQSLLVRVGAAFSLAENGVRNEAVISALKEGAQSDNQHAFVDGVGGLKKLGLPTDAYRWAEPNEEPPPE